MNRTLPRILIAAGLLYSLSASADAQPDTLDLGLKQLQSGWATARYRTPESQQDEAFAALSRKAADLVANHPGRAEPLIWEAIVESTHAGVTGGLGALSKVKHARELLAQAERLDPTALQGSIYTSLGSLYYQVPGWPLGFGDDEQAETYLRKALALNPDGIDPNYFYGDFLLDQERYQEAVTYLEKALAAPPRPERPIADAGRREEARQALSRARAHLNHG